MDTLTTALLAALMFLAAVLYTSVGHAGASAYLAAMALFGVAPNVMKPTALALNIVVATYAAVRYLRAGRVEWPLLWPFALGAVPFAFLGGAIHLPGSYYRPLVGAVLLFAAVRLWWTPATHATQPPQKVWMVLSGACIGLLSGLTGTGGGIFLSPLIIFSGWAEPLKTAGVAICFILANSAAGLAGNLSSVGSLPPELPIWLVAVLLGAFVGTTLGIRKFDTHLLLRALAGVLVIAGFKLILF